VLGVHHDLRTVPQYFEQVICLNRGLVASGPTSQGAAAGRTRLTDASVPVLVRTTLRRHPSR